MNETAKPKVGAIFIAYNAEHTLESFYKNFSKAGIKTAILVDDASRDRTFELAQKLGIQSYKNPVNLGYGGNMKRALDLALEHDLDVIIDIHPDGEYDASAIPLALEEIEKGANFVLGNRFTSLSEPLKSGMFVWKLLPILFLNFLARMVLGVKLNDLHQGFRVYTRKLLTGVDFNQNSNGYLFSFELVAQAVFSGMKIVQVPVATCYTGKKRGASLRHSIIYTLGVQKILIQYLFARLGIQSRLFRSVPTT